MKIYIQFQAHSRGHLQFLPQDGRQQGLQRGPVPQRVRPGELRHAVGAAGPGHVRRPRPPSLGLRQQV